MSANSKKIKLGIFYGTRPEFLKLIPVIKLIESKYADVIDLTVVSTGQHLDMLRPLEVEFGFTPHRNFEILKQAKELFDVYGMGLSEISQFMKKHSFDVAMAQGDTATVFVTALACYLEKIPFVHLEAGMRTGDIYSPFPEEVNRKMTSCLTTLHLAWSQVEVVNLITEGVKPEDIVVTGNTLIDTLLSKLDPLKHASEYFAKSEFPFGFKIILVTQHRRENFGEKHRNIFSSIKEILMENPEYVAIYPVHKNPLVKQQAEEFFKDVDRVYLTQPLEYVPFINLMAQSALVITDSGGVQEEAPSCGVPVIVTRDKTERPLVVEAGRAFLTADNKDLIKQVFNYVKTNWNYANRENPYGDGNSAERVVAAILARYS